MRVEPVDTRGDFGVDVTVTDEVQLLFAHSTSGIDREQDGPCHQTSNKAYHDGDFKVTQQEEAVEGMVVEDIAIWDFVEGSNPIEESIR